MSSMKRPDKPLRFDLQMIASWIEPGARVLDLGCGEGSLLEHLIQHKKVIGSGIEQDEGNLPTNVIETAIADFLTYIAVFDQGDSFLSVTGTAQPNEVAIDEGDPLSGDLQIEIAAFIVIDEVTYDVDLTIDANVDLDTGELTGTAEIFLDDDAGTEGTLSGPITSTRN